MFNNYIDMMSEIGREHLCMVAIASPRADKNSLPEIRAFFPFGPTRLVPYKFITRESVEVRIQGPSKPNLSPVT